MTAAVDCPTCGAPAASACADDNGRPLATPHPDRTIAARTEAFAGLTKPKPRRSWWREATRK